jgi:hypothetical protein
MVVDGLKQRDIERVAGIQDAERAITEAAWPISAYMGERGHQVTGAWTSDAALCWDEIKVADGLHQARVRFLLS